MISASLKRKLKSHQPKISQSHAIRLHRAISWLRAAEEQEKVPDLRLICLWISMNGLYAMDEVHFEQMQERERFADFVDRLVACDHESRLHNILWNKFSGPVRLLIENKFVYGPFWDTTFKSQVNRAQVRDGGNILLALLPVVIELMIQHPESDWGKIYFPPVE